jgi:hypothetical protein
MAARVASRKEGGRVTGDGDSGRGSTRTRMELIWRSVNLSKFERGRNERKRDGSG